MWLKSSLLLLIFCEIGQAAQIPQFTVSLYRGTTKVTDVSADTEIGAFLLCFEHAKTIQATTTSKVVCKTPVMSLATVPDPPPPSQVTLTWPLVTQNTDGSAYTDPFGYVINYGNAPDQLTQSIDVNDPNAAKYVVQGLTAGQWFFCVRSRNTSNVRSDCSNVVSKTL